MLEGLIVNDTLPEGKKRRLIHLNEPPPCYLIVLNEVSSGMPDGNINLLHLGRTVRHRIDWRDVTRTIHRKDLPVSTALTRRWGELLDDT